MNSNEPISFSEVRLRIIRWGIYLWMLLFFVVNITTGNERLTILLMAVLVASGAVMQRGLDKVPQLAELRDYVGILVVVGGLIIAYRLVSPESLLGELFMLLALVPLPLVLLPILWPIRRRQVIFLAVGVVFGPAFSLAIDAVGAWFL